MNVALFSIPPLAPANSTSRVRYHCRYFSVFFSGRDSYTMVACLVLDSSHLADQETHRLIFQVASRAGFWIICESECFLLHMIELASVKCLFKCVKEGRAASMSTSKNCAVAFRRRTCYIWFFVSFSCLSFAVNLSFPHEIIVVDDSILSNYRWWPC